MSETAIKFNTFYQYVWFKNIGDGDAYVSIHPNIQADADDVAFLPAGDAVMLAPVKDTVYVLGETIIEAHAQSFANTPFLDAGGEGGGGGDITVEQLNATENTTYTAPSGTAYSPVVVNVSPNVDTKSVTQNGTYTASSENLDGYSSVEVSVPNSYVAADEGKVVSSGALVSQSSITKTQNGTYDTTLNNEVVINVPRMTRTLLWGSSDYSTPAVVNTPYNLADDLDSYDEICVVSSTENDIANDNIWSNFYDVVNIRESGKQILLCPHSDRVLVFTVTDTTFTVISASSGSELSGYTPQIYQIYGYKY